MKTPVTVDPRLHDAVIFDLDGVVTDTASIHAAAWTTMFNDFLERRPANDNENHAPFTDNDYRHFVDGKPRHDGVADFLASRGIRFQKETRPTAPKTRCAGSATASSRSSASFWTPGCRYSSRRSFWCASWPKPGLRPPSIPRAAIVNRS